MHKRQALKAKAKAKPFTGFSGSPERIALLEMMRPQVSWRDSRRAERVRELIAMRDAGDLPEELEIEVFANECALGQIGSKVKRAEERREAALAILRETAPAMKAHTHAREFARRMRQMQLAKSKAATHEGAAHA